MQDPANLADKRQGTVVECVAGFEREGQLLALYGVGSGATAEAYPVRSARWRVRRRLPRRHRHRVARAADASWPSRVRSSRSSTTPRAPRCSSTSTARCRRSCSTRRRRSRCPAARAALARLVPRPRTGGGRERSSRGVPAATRSRSTGSTTSGTYGLERIVAGDVVLDERVRPYLDAIAQAADEAEAALPGLHVERKGRWRSPSTGATSPSGATTPPRWAAEAARPPGARGTAAGPDGGGAASAGAGRQGHDRRRALAAASDAGRVRGRRRR